MKQRGNQFTAAKVIDVLSTFAMNGVTSHGIWKAGRTEPDRKRFANTAGLVGAGLITLGLIPDLEPETNPFTTDIRQPTAKAVAKVGLGLAHAATASYIMRKRMGSEFTKLQNEFADPRKYPK